MKMVTVQLTRPTHVDGKLRRPEEGGIATSEDEAKRIVDADNGEILETKDEKPAAKKAG